MSYESLSGRSHDTLVPEDMSLNVVNRFLRVELLAEVMILVCQEIQKSCIISKNHSFVVLNSWHLTSRINLKIFLILMLSLKRINLY